jgi:hypothetical protein
MSEPGYEYDIAVSFAGEQREYAEAVVRGLGTDLTVFYDADEKAKLLGENLIDLLTDLYQNQARYVVMFVSRAYAEKMWPNVERQSAMARAAQQRSAYILPVRMDDTELPGLLPTVGFLDARIEGLDGVVSIIREKLGNDRTSATYHGRVPQTQADLQLLLALRPDWWEYWLYAGALKLGLENLEDKYRDYEMGFAKPTGEHYAGRDAFEFLRSASANAQNLAEAFNVVLAANVQQRAFGAPGEPGDADRIMHMAQRLLDVYEGFIDEAARLRGASVPDEFRRAQAAAARFGVQPIERIRRFVCEFDETVAKLPEMVAGRTERDEPLTIEMPVELTVDDEIIEEFGAGLRDGVESLS